MNKIIIGAAIGVGIGYLARKLQEEGFLDQLSDDIDVLASKTKKKVKNAWDENKNEAEYLGERAKDTFQKGKEKLDDMHN